MEEKQRQHCEEQENIDELKRYREETAEENKVIYKKIDLRNPTSYWHYT